MGTKSIAAIIAASLVAGFVLGGLGVAGAGSTTTPTVAPVQQGACGGGAGACGDAVAACGDAAAACGTAQCDPAAAQCDPGQKAACPSTSGGIGACGQGSCP